MVELGAGLGQLNCIQRLETECINMTVNVTGGRSELGNVF